MLKHRRNFGAVIISLVFAASMLAIFYLGPNIVRQAIVSDAHSLAFNTLHTLEQKFDLPGKPSEYRPSWFARIVSRIVAADDGSESNLDLFKTSEFEAGRHFGELRSYAVHTQFKDRFLRGGGLPALSLENDLYLNAFTQVIAENRQITVSFSDNAGRGVITTFIPLTRFGQVRAVAFVEVQEVGLGAIIARSVQTAGMVSAGIVGILFILVAAYLHRSLRARLSAESTARYFSNFDALTRLPNRASFERDMANLHKDCKLTLLLIDLDDFKNTNDRYGHLAGDAVLQHVADCLVQSIPDDSYITRWAGDEFVCVLLGERDDEQISDLTISILDAVCRPIMFKGVELITTVSIGSSTAMSDEEAGLDLDQLIHRADLALYTAKANSGKGRHCAYDESMDSDRRRRQEVTERLKLAIEEDSLRLAYQPQYDVANRQIRGFEALLRWVDPKLGQVSPAEFIPIAEECGLIVDIGTWVLRRACQQAAEWPGEYLVAVNISSAQIEEDGFTGLVEAALADSGLAADRLELELTETMLLNWTDETERCLSTLRQMNVGIAMDDFGTGHSSLTYLASIPISKLKIDKSFVDHVGDHGPNDAIVKAVVSLADNLNLTVIAEGVETIQQSHMLESLGCTNIQGYLYGKPEFEPFSAKGPVNRLIEEAAERLQKEVA